MTEILKWADGQGLGEIRCIIAPGNTASRNVAGKLGFVKFAESHDVMGDQFIYRREPCMER
jgi:RimJ/RimL family protein N-acetyltransferase